MADDTDCGPGRIADRNWRAAGVTAASRPVGPRRRIARLRPDDNHPDL